MHTPIQTLLVANRGEIAVRVLRTCREMGVRTIAVYSDADRLMPHVLMADEAYRLGPAPARESYLRMDRILEIAKDTGADAIHPGYGFLSENPDFADMVTAAGIRFVGPPGAAIRAMGDKTAARALMREAGVPTVPGTDGPVHGLDDAERFCAEAGFPVLIKAAAGGGGKGMRVVQRHEDLRSALEQAESEARSSFGDARVYIERYLDQPRHIEFQILADVHGNCIHLGERECSIQRRHQKVVEETPSVVLDDMMRLRMGETAVRAARACGYVNAGTIEFLVDASRNFYFLEMNTRLQVEHPVTELRTGLDLVREQLLITGGEPLALSQEDVVFRGHAIECRICAEDPASGFLPSTGTIRRLRPAQGPGVRDDRGIEEGGEVSVYYDPLIAKVVVWAQDRPLAIARMERALHEYEIVGVTTNIPVCTFVMRHPAFRAGTFDTGFIRRYYDAAAGPVSGDGRLAAAALLSAWLERTDPVSPHAEDSSGNGVLSAWKARRTAASWNPRR